MIQRPSYCLVISFLNQSAINNRYDYTFPVYRLQLHKIYRHDVTLLIACINY